MRVLRHCIALLLVFKEEKNNIERIRTKKDLINPKEQDLLPASSSSQCCDNWMLNEEHPPSAPMDRWS